MTLRLLSLLHYGQVTILAKLNRKDKRLFFSRSDDIDKFRFDICYRQKKRKS